MTVSDKVSNSITWLTVLARILSILDKILPLILVAKNHKLRSDLKKKEMELIFKSQELKIERAKNDTKTDTNSDRAVIDAFLRDSKPKEK